MTSVGRRQPGMRVQAPAFLKEKGVYLHYQKIEFGSRRWIEQPPDWLEIREVNTQPNTELEDLDRGELEAILLVEQLGAN